MGQINDVDRSVFSNAYKTVQENFTIEELKRIGELASELKAILETANRRQQEKFGGARTSL